MWYLLLTSHKSLFPSMQFINCSAPTKNIRWLYDYMTQQQRFNFVRLTWRSSDITCPSLYILQAPMQVSTCFFVLWLSRNSHHHPVQLYLFLKFCKVSFDNCLSSLCWSSINYVLFFLLYYFMLVPALFTTWSRILPLQVSLFCIMFIPIKKTQFTIYFIQSTHTNNHFILPPIIYI